MAKVLVVGSGAREHALLRAFATEGHELVCAPGNAGTELLAKRAAVKADDVPGLVALAKSESVDLVVVGPEVPLTLGIVDAMNEVGVLTFGPSKRAASLEHSKVYMKRFLSRYEIPTAAYAVFDNAHEAEQYVRNAGRPLVVKADGLCAGKGVVVAKDTAEALEAVDRIMRQRSFGSAGDSVVIEELLPGREASFHVICDGTRFIALPAAEDHKQLLDGDKGPNTGGMGAVLPCETISEAVKARVIREIVEPTLKGMAADGAPFRGVLFVGLMIENDVPRVLEYNVRFGDPETSVLVPSYAGSWFELLSAAARGDMSQVHPRFDEGAFVSVVMCAEGYPDAPRNGDDITGLDVADSDDVWVLHAGTERIAGNVVTSGGRVLNVVSRGATLAEAREKAYARASKIHFAGMQLRRDIGGR